AESCIHTFSGNSHMMELDLVNENKYNIRTAFMPVVEGDESLETEGIEKGITYFSTMGKEHRGYDLGNEEDGKIFDLDFGDELFADYDCDSQLGHFTIRTGNGNDVKVTIEKEGVSA
ncbi:MAG: hypothetical protein FWH05_07475, partial [Oscillospiraceae bacterium]|nr:hypothetical protein [Oscillospiraceae bacterium]